MLARWFLLELDPLCIFVEIPHHRDNGIQSVVDSLLLLLLVSGGSRLAELVEVFEQLLSSEQGAVVDGQSIQQEYMSAAIYVLQQLFDGLLANIEYNM